MAKKQLYFNEAERLYVIEQKTIAEIASRLRLSEKTVRNWKEEGDWQNKRYQYLQGKKAFHEELYQFARKLMKSIQADMDAGVKVDPGRLYAFTRLIPMLIKVKDYEETMKAHQEDEKKNVGLTDELLKLIEKDVLGM